MCNENGNFFLSIDNSLYALKMRKLRARRKFIVRSYHTYNNSFSETLNI